MKIALSALFFVIALCSCTAQQRVFTERSNLHFESPNELRRSLGDPVEVEIVGPNTATGVVPASRWIYYFEAPDGSIEEIGYYFVAGSWKTNEALFHPLTRGQQYRLLSPRSAADMEKIYAFKHGGL